MSELDNNQDYDLDFTIDVEAAASELSSNLFGPEEGGSVDGAGEEDSQNLADTVESSSSTDSDPAGAKGGDPESGAGEGEGSSTEQNSAEVQAIGAPETWTKEAIADWAKIPPRAQREILKREQDILRGLGEYKEKAELGTKYDKVVEPYRPMLAAENIDPVELFSAFSGNHYLLSRGTPEQKVQVAANLVRSYGLDIDQIKAQLGETYTPPSPEIQALQKELNELKSGVKSRETAEHEARISEFSRTVDAFASDPKNLYWDEVADDIANLLKTGVATSLQDAYDKAVYQNPVTRQKELDRLTAEKVSAAQEEQRKKLEAANKAKGVNVSTSSKTRDGTIPVGTMDDTLNETLNKIQNRGG